MKTMAPPNLYLTQAQINALDPAAFDYYRRWLTGLNYDALPPYEQDQLAIAARYVNARVSRELGEPGFEVTVRDGVRPGVSFSEVPWWFWGIGATLGVLILVNLFDKPR